jgi:hypothetical protein
MNDDALARLLVRKDRELRLLLAIDEVRDSADDDADPRPMLNALLNLLLETFEASSGALALLAETSDDIEYIANLNVDSDHAVEICQIALALEQPTPIERPAPPYLIGMRLTMRHLPLGSLFLGRETPFEADALLLLRIAARQIDSAILQAHTILKLLQRTRELDLIYRIDHLRDTIRSEREMLHAFASVLIEEYTADIGFVLTPQTDAIVSAVVRDDLPPLIPALRAETAHIQFPQIIPMQPGLAARDANKTPLSLLAAPFIVDGERLGAVIVGRVMPFTVSDHRLLFAMTSQIDSAVVHLRLLERISRLENELAANRNFRLE